jgi:hypothetical protein
MQGRGAQKVSCGFHSEAGVQRHDMVSSYISGVRKKGRNLIEIIKAAFTGNSIQLNS